jgi:hypothetical protein
VSDEKVGDLLCMAEAHEVFLVVLFSHDIPHERFSGSSVYAGENLSASREGLAHGSK